MEEKKEERKKITAPMLVEMKQKGQKFSMVTCYDYPFAVMVDQAGIDVVLVGDSLGMTMLGYETTLPVTMDMMIHHAKAVRRGLKYPLLIGDMPFMAYQASVEEAVRNAGRFMKEAECDAIKLEGGASVIPQVKAIVQSGIPMMGHLGLTRNRSSPSAASKRRAGRPWPPRRFWMMLWRWRMPGPSLSCWSAYR